MACRTSFVVFLCKTGPQVPFAPTTHITTVLLYYVVEHNLHVHIDTCYDDMPALENALRLARRQAGAGHGELRQTNDEKNKNDMQRIMEARRQLGKNRHPERNMRKHTNTHRPAAGHESSLMLPLTLWFYAATIWFVGLFVAVFPPFTGCARLLLGVGTSDLQLHPGAT